MAFIPFLYHTMHDGIYSWVSDLWLLDHFSNALWDLRSGLKCSSWTTTKQRSQTKPTGWSRPAAPADVSRMDGRARRHLAAVVVQRQVLQGGDQLLLLLLLVHAVLGLLVHRVGWWRLSRHVAGVQCDALRGGGGRQHNCDKHATTAAL